MLDMVDMFFIILIMLLCKLHVFMFIKEQPILFVMSFNKHVWKDTSLYQVGKKMRKMFSYSVTQVAQKKKN